MKTLAIVRAYGETKQKLLKGFDEKLVEVFDFDLEVEKMLGSGQEGYRQVLNFFGEDFVSKNGHLNTKKLWKFVYQDHHKLRILCFLIEPLLFNQMQKIKDFTDKKVLLVFLPGLVGADAYKYFDHVVWLHWSKEVFLQKLNGITLPVPVEQYLDRQMRLFLMPSTQVEVVDNELDWQERIEGWRKFLYK